MSSYGSKRTVGNKYKKSYKPYTPYKRSRYNSSTSLSLKPYSIKQTMDYGVFEVATGVGSLDTQFTVKTKLNDFGNSASLKGLYDEYRIKKITVAIHNLTGSPTLGQGAPAALDSVPIPTIYTCVDYTDDTGISCTDILQYQDAKVAPFYNSHYRSYTPRIDASSVVGTVASQGWCPTTYDTNLWYGLKGCFQNNRGVGIGEVANFVYQIIVTATLEFRNVK